MHDCTLKAHLVGVVHYFFGGFSYWETVEFRQKS